MFCPKCAAKNEDDTKFCRSCGQDVSLVVRAVEGHASLAIAGKVDKLFDRHNERLLRDAVLYTFLGLLSAGFIFVENVTDAIPSLGYLILQVIYSAWGFFWGLVSVVAYRRSSAVSTGIKGSEEALFCPVCGMECTVAHNDCRGCGYQLEELRKVLPSRRIGPLGRFLDGRIESSRRASGKYEPIQMAAIFAVAQLYFFLPSVINDGVEILPVVNLLALIAILFAIALWDVVFQKRVTPDEESTAAGIEKARSHASWIIFAGLAMCGWSLLVLYNIAEQEYLRRYATDGGLRGMLTPERIFSWLIGVAFSVSVLTFGSFQMRKLNRVNNPLTLETEATTQLPSEAATQRELGSPVDHQIWPQDKTAKIASVTEATTRPLDEING